MPQRQCIAIIGFPNAGKTTLSQRLATALSLDTVHLDSVHRPNPRTALQQQGTTRFISREYQTLTSLKMPCIIDCGGGTPLYQPAQQWLSECSFCLYVDHPLHHSYHLSKEHGRYPQHLATWWIKRHMTYQTLATHKTSAQPLDQLIAFLASSICDWI